MSNPRDVPAAAQPSSSADTWDAIRPELEKRFGGQPAQQTAVASIAAANSAAAQVALFGYAPATAPKPEEPKLKQAATGTVVRAFWWGFHVEFGHDDLETILTSADAVNTVVSLSGGNIPEPGAAMDPTFWRRSSPVFIKDCEAWTRAVGSTSA